MSTFDTGETINWHDIVRAEVRADLQAHYELGFLCYPHIHTLGHKDTVEQQAWQEGWNDAKDLADCEHFDHSPQKRAMGMTI